MTVFVVQRPQRYDRGSHCWVPTANLEPAKAYGELVDLLPPAYTAVTGQPLVVHLRHQLRNYGTNDYLLPTGDPCLTAIAAAIASSMNAGRVNLLRWDKTRRQYDEVRIKI